MCEELLFVPMCVPDMSVIELIRARARLLVSQFLRLCTIISNRKICCMYKKTVWISPPLSRHPNERLRQLYKSSGDNTGNLFYQQAILSASISRGLFSSSEAAKYSGFIFK